MLVSDQDSSITKINLKIFLALCGVKTYLGFMAKTMKATGKRKWAWRAVGTELMFGLWPVAELAKDEAEYLKVCEQLRALKVLA